MNKKVESVVNRMLYQSPIGQILVYCQDGFIVKIDFVDETDIKLPHSENTPVLSDCISQLDLYFTGKLKSFTIPYRPSGTAFQQRVWQTLTNIPFGKTISYSELARMIDHPKAVRAVGGANNSNNLSIVIPCHRVVGADGSLTGYAGGLWRKKWLIEHERNHQHLNTNY